jgi:hypothetical protein
MREEKFSKKEEETIMTKKLNSLSNTKIVKQENKPSV